MIDYLIALFAGTVIGFVMTIPVGPVGIIVFRQAMFRSRRSGLVTGSGAALADGFLASVGAFGLSFIGIFIHDYGFILRVIGGLIILIIGIFYVVSKANHDLKKKKDNTLTRIERFLSGFALTISNPIAAFTFLFVFARLGQRFGIGQEASATGLVIGVVIGSFLWWLFLTYVADVIGHKVKPAHLKTINTWFGYVLLVLGGIMILGAFL